MKFNDILEITESNSKKNNLSIQDTTLLYNFVLQNILKKECFNNLYSDIYISNGKQIEGNVFSTSINPEYHYNIYNNSRSKIPFFEKILLNKENELVSKFYKNLKEGTSLSDIGSNFNHIEILKLKNIMGFEEDVFSTLFYFSKKDIEENMFIEKDEQKLNNSIFDIAYNESNYLSNLKFMIGFNDNQKFTIENLETLIDKSQLKEILALSGFKLIDFDIESLSDFIDDDFLENTPIGILLNSTSSIEFSSKTFDLIMFDSVKSKYIDLCERQLLENTIEEILSKDSKLNKIFNDIILEIENKFLELNYQINEIVLTENEEEESIMFIDKINLFNLNDLKYSIDNKYIFKYFNFDNGKFFNYFNNDNYEDKNISRFIIESKTTFYSKALMSILKINNEEFGEERNILKIDKLMISNFATKEDIREMFKTAFELAAKEEKILSVNIQEFKRFGIMDYYLDIRKEFKNTISEDYNAPLIYNSKIDQVKLSYKDNIILKDGIDKIIQKYKTIDKFDEEILLDKKIENYVSEFLLKKEIKKLNI